MPAASGLTQAQRALRRAAVPSGLISFGVASLDQALSGGLACGAVHEISPAVPLHGGAATGFVVALTALALALGRHGRAVWIEPDFDAVEAGAPYGPGLDLLGLPMGRLVILRVARPRDALWAMEEVLKCRTVRAVVAEIDNGSDLAMRRLALAASESGGFGLILRNAVAAGTATTAATRWEVASICAETDRFGGLGPMTFALSLVKNRRGRTGQWRLSWHHHERKFVEHATAAAALPLGVAAAARDRSSADRPLAAAGSGGGPHSGFAAPASSVRPGPGENRVSSG